MQGSGLLENKMGLLYLSPMRAAPPFPEGKDREKRSKKAIRDCYHASPLNARLVDKGTRTIYI